MRTRGFLLTIGIYFCFFVSYSQSQCEALLDAARKYKNKGEYAKAVENYNSLEKKCPNYFTETVRSERNDCKKMVESQNRPKPQKTSSGYIPSQQYESVAISNRDAYFDDEGVCQNNTNEIRVFLNDWYFIVYENCQDWLKVERSGNLLIVTCYDNPNKEDRIGKIAVLGASGESHVIDVTQYGRKSSPKSKTRTNPTEQINSIEQTKEEQPIIVKITFEKGKSKPKFDNNIGPLITAMGENKNLDLQIEVYKCESQSGLKNFIKAPLIDKRFKEIMEYFGSFEITTDRISKNIIVIDGDKSGAECDCAYAKTKKKE